MAETNSNKVGAVWVRKSKTSGNQYLSMQLELDGKKYNLSAFKNKNKVEDKHPNFLVFPSNPPGQPSTAPAVAKKPETAPEEDLLA